MPNPFAHIELTTTDLPKARKFYKGLFDWKLSDAPTPPGAPPYTMIAAGKGPGGGMQAQPMPDAPVTWLPYVEVDDVKRSLAKVEKLGGKVILPVMDVGKNGIIGIFVDPAGATLGLWSRAKPAPKANRKSAAKKTAPRKAATKPAKKSSAKKSSAKKR